MCGIIAIAGTKPVASRLLEGLKRLEYRGYDSAGLAIQGEARIERRRAPGRIANLEAALSTEPTDGLTGLAHTRWATHGRPTTANAHPHMVGGVAIVHNGIIENHAELREALQARGAQFDSETDSEVIAHLIHAALVAGKDPPAAFQSAIGQLKGAFAIAALFAAHDGLVLGARLGSPLVIGIGEGETFIASDFLAVRPFTKRVIYLEEGDWCVIAPGTHHVFDASGAAVDRAIRDVRHDAFAADLSGFSHFMEKEISEQPDAISQTLLQAVDVGSFDLFGLEALAAQFATLSRAHFVSCGTSHYASLTAAYWFEALAGLPVKCDVASEFRYRRPALRTDEMAIVISQSGETADTLAAMRHAAAQGLSTLGVVNVPESAIWREAQHRFPTMAGPEIGVASTKAFTAQLAALGVLAVLAGKARGALSTEEARRKIAELASAPGLVAAALQTRQFMRDIAPILAQAPSALFMGRNEFYPLALEGALKLKEISYIHAEGFAAGELKHGPLALVDERMPVIVIAPSGELLHKTLSNVEEIRARGARVLLITDAAGARAAKGLAEWTCQIPDAPGLAAPLVVAAPLQWLAYEVALARGYDVDKPRNLAKSVTVE